MAVYRITVELFLFVVVAAVSNFCHATNIVEQSFVGAFDIGPQGNAQKFNPLTASAGFSFYNKYFSTLTLYDVSFQKISGDLAESWRFESNGKHLIIKLRKDVKWHDGAMFTANDVKFTLGLIQDPDIASVFAVRLNSVVGINVIDNFTVSLELSRMDASLPDALTGIMMLPQHLLAKFSAKELRTSEWWKKPIGTGPFKWTKYLPDQYVELSANADYFRGKPKIAKIVNRYFKNSSSAEIALATGEIQYSYLTYDQVKENDSNRTYHVISGPSQVLNYIGFNNADLRFKDIRVRKALLLAIDRNAIIKNLYGDNAAAGKCVLTSPKYVPADIDKYDANIAKAKTLLNEAGWEKVNKGEQVELLTYYNDQVSKDVITTLQFMLGMIGINIKPRFVDGPTFSQIVDAGKFSLVFAGAGNGPDPAILMPLMYSSYVPPKGVNRMRVNISELDKLFDAGQRELNDTKRIDIYKQVCRLTNAQLPWIPLWTVKRYGGFSKRLQNVIWTPSPGGGRYQDSPENWTLR